MSTVVFLGGGRITAALLAGLQLSKTKHRLVVHDRHPSKLRALKKTYGVISEDDLQTAVAQADLLVIAVRPDSVRDLLSKIEKHTRPLLAVSLAAGVPLRHLKNALGPPIRWARAMPSPASRSGRGLTALTFPRELAHADRIRVHQFFAGVGQVVEIPERKFDAFTVTYSSSHGYHALDALAIAGQRAGLDRKTALLASAHALADGIVAWRCGRNSLKSLLEEAATPGGIAATTMAGMESAGYSKAVRKGVLKGIQRARANARRFWGT